jgi:hypothetical protein
MENISMNIEQEIADVKRDIELLASTEGWSKLSQKQQEYLKTSLYVSRRAMRERGDRNQQRYESNFRGLGETGLLQRGQIPKNSAPSGYDNSQDRIASWNCAHSIFVLENDGVETLPTPKVDSDFSNSEYHLCPSQSDLELRIDGMGFPCIVHLSEAIDNSKYDEDEMVHSFLVLGKNNEKYICWEKVRPGLPYKVRGLNEIFELNRDYRYWGVRELRSLSGKKPTSVDTCPKEL